MPDNITYTGTDGPGLTITAQLFTNVKDLNFDLSRKVLFISYDSPQGPRTLDVSLNASTTATISISSGVWTVAVS